MDSQTLVTDELEGGKLLVNDLERQGVCVRVAYWRRTSDEPSWRLRLATEHYEKVGPLGLYSFAMIAIQRLDVTQKPQLGSLEFISLNHREVLDLRYFAGTPVGPYLDGELQSGGRVGDSYFDGLYIYRAEQLPAWEGVVPVTFATRVSGAWTAHPGTLTFADGLLVEVACEGVEVRQKLRDGRLKAKFVLVENEERKDGLPTGTLTRYEYDHGRLWQRDARSRRVKLAAPLAVA